jgi:hypothetical protein
VYLDDPAQLAQMERLLVAVGEHLLHASQLLPALLEPENRGGRQYFPVAARPRFLGELVDKQLVADGLDLDKDVAVVGVLDVVLRVELEAAEAVVGHGHLDDAGPHGALRIQFSTPCTKRSFCKLEHKCRLWIMSQRY